MGIGDGQKMSSKQVFVENFTSTVINSGNKTDSTQRNSNTFKSMKSRQLLPKRPKGNAMGANQIILFYCLSITKRCLKHPCLLITIISNKNGEYGIGAY
jgi:hypothetical protein